MHVQVCKRARVHQRHCTKLSLSLSFVYLLFMSLSLSSLSVLVLIIQPELDGLSTPQVSRVK